MVCEIWGGSLCSRAGGAGGQEWLSAQADRPLLVTLHVFGFRKPSFFQSSANANGLMSRCQDGAAPGSLLIKVAPTYSQVSRACLRRDCPALETRWGKMLSGRGSLGWRSVQNRVCGCPRTHRKQLVLGAHLLLTLLSPGPFPDRLWA